MKVKNLVTGKVEEYHTSYGERLVEQGRAVPVPEGKRGARAEEKPAGRARKE